MTGNTGQVLGASTATAAGIASLPLTSGSPILVTLSMIAIASGVVVLLSLIASKAAKRIITRNSK